MSGLSHSDQGGHPRSSYAAGQEHAGSYSHAAHLVQMRQPDLQEHSELPQQPTLSTLPGQDQCHKNQDREVRPARQAQSLVRDPWQTINPEQRVSRSCQCTILFAHTQRIFFARKKESAAV